MRTMDTIHIGHLAHDDYHEYHVIVWRDGHRVTSALVEILSDHRPTICDFLALGNGRKTDADIIRKAREILSECGFEDVDTATEKRV